MFEIDWKQYVVARMLLETLKKNKEEESNEMLSHFQFFLFQTNKKEKRTQRKETSFYARETNFKV